MYLKINECYSRVTSWRKVLNVTRVTMYKDNWDYIKTCRLNSALENVFSKIKIPVCLDDELKTNQLKLEL